MNRKGKKITFLFNLHGLRLNEPLSLNDLNDKIVACDILVKQRDGRMSLKVTDRDMILKSESSSDLISNEDGTALKHTYFSFDPDEWAAKF